MLLSFIIYNFSKLTIFLIAYTIKKLLLETHIIFIHEYQLLFDMSIKWFILLLSLNNQEIIIVKMQMIYLKLFKIIF